jgi:hypothetical protein
MVVASLLTNELRMRQKNETIGKFANKTHRISSELQNCSYGVAGDDAMHVIGP